VSRQILEDLEADGVTEFRLARSGRADSLQVKIGALWLDYYKQGSYSARPVLWSLLRDRGYTQRDLDAVSDVLVCAAAERDGE
jgi:hypothetical protein